MLISKFSFSLYTNAHPSFCAARMSDSHTLSLCFLLWYLVFFTCIIVRFQLFIGMPSLVIVDDAWNIEGVVVVYFLSCVVCVRVKQGKDIDLMFS